MGDKNQTTFGIIIPDAFGFRSLVEFLNHVGFKIITLYVSSSRVYIKERNENVNIDVDVDFDLLRLNFYYTSTLKFFKVSLDTAKLAAELKMATVKTSLQIVKETNEKALTFSVYSQNISGDPSNTVIIDPIERTTIQRKWQINELEEDELNSNFFVSALDFSKLSSAFKEKKKNRDQKILSVRITGYNEGFVFSATAPNGGPRVSSRGETTLEDKILSYTVPQTLIDSFSDIHKFNKQNGIVNFFFEKNKPIKIMIPVSNFALIRLYIDEYKELDE